MLSLKAPQLLVKASLTLPGSKSISNRAIILKHILNASTELQNLSDAEDTVLLKRALHQVKTKQSEPIDVGHAGTDLRFLTALLSVTPGEWLLQGTERLSKRPIAGLVNSLVELGAEIAYDPSTGSLPLKIIGKKLKGGSISPHTEQSSQFASALLLIAPLLEKGLELRLDKGVVSRPYLGMTVEIMKKFGIGIDDQKLRITVSPVPVRKPPEVYRVEADWSAASYWYAVCALSPGSEISLKGLHQQSMQPDAILPEIFSSLGVTTTFAAEGIMIVNKENTSGSLITSAVFTCDFSSCPDIAQTLAVTCFALGLRARLTGLQTLKHKETDRITALKAELEKLGARVKAGDDFIEIDSSAIKMAPGHIVQTYQDHRMALSFAPLSLKTGDLRFDDADVVNKSYPGFWQDLISLGFNVNLQP
jgi:3-phosphoshikimate 1-carboxyvinyltransferase